MSKNSMTPEQDLLTREFYSTVACDANLFPQDPVGQRNMIQCLLRLLNYQVIDGKYITPGKVLSKTLGGKVNVDCEWDADTQRTLEALNGSNNDTSTPETNSGESSTYSKIRKAVLREDV